MIVFVLGSQNCLPRSVAFRTIAGVIPRSDIRFNACLEKTRRGAKAVDVRAPPTAVACLTARRTPWEAAAFTVAAPPSTTSSPENTEGNPASSKAPPHKVASRAASHPDA